MTKHNILLFLLIVCLSVSAKDRTPADMKRIAVGVLNHNTTRGLSSELTCITETETYSIYGYEDCFAIISRDDRSDAVLGYSMTPFEKDNIPCGLRWWLSAIDNRLQAAPMMNRKSQTRTVPKVVEPMLTSKWGQGDPYNAKCPTFNGKKAPVGCGATAMSQLLYFYKYPEMGEGVGYYTLGDASHKYSITVNSIYNWDQIKPSYAGSWFMTDEEKEDISQLCFHAGVACHMNYASNGSATVIQEVAYGLCSIFKFDSLSVKCLNRDYCTDEEWIETIYREFENGHPLIMQGVDPNFGGHAFVIDGIDEQGLIHVNWGWNGSSDGYYSMNDMNPTGILGSSSMYHFNYNQAIITNLICNPVPAEGAKYRSCWVFDAEDNLVPDNLKGLILSGPEAFFSYYHLTFYGQVGLRFVDDQGKEVLFCPVLDTKKDGPVAGGYGFYLSYFNHVTVADLASLPSGTYRAYMASKAIQDEEPQYICYPGGKHNEYTITKADDGSLTISKETAGINTIQYNKPILDNGIYDLHGRKMGTDPSALRKGIYIIGGKKVVK